MAKETVKTTNKNYIIMNANLKTYLLMYCKRNKIAHAYYWSNEFQVEIIKDALLSRG